MNTKEPIDYNSPLGISKSEWTKVLGVNLALLLLVYAVAIVFTLCGSDLFLLNFRSADLARIETTLREFKIFPIIQGLFATLEATIIGSYIAKAKPKWWVSLSFFGTLLTANIIFTYTIGSYPSFATNAIMIAFWVLCVFSLNKWKPSERWFIYLFRFVICLAISFILNEGIALFRIKTAELWLNDIQNSIGFVLNVEYDLALVLAFGFLTLVIPWKKKGGSDSCPICRGASGSSPNTRNSLPKNSKIAKTDLPAKYKKRLCWLKAKVITIQTIALIVIAALPWFTGRPVEFALVYASFCMTRICLGFNRSLHFKSELSCVTIGAFTFWGLTYLAPSAEASIIMSLIYGAGLALGFRLYWELHDLLMYHKAAKTDRYAMFYTVFKGNIDPRHINGYMRMKGYSEKNDISMVQMYMQRDKVEYIAQVLSFARITIEKRLTEIATDLYARR